MNLLGDIAGFMQIDKEVALTQLPQIVDAYPNAIRVYVRAALHYIREYLKENGGYADIISVLSYRRSALSSIVEEGGRDGAMHVDAHLAPRHVGLAYFIEPFDTSHDGVVRCAAHECTAIATRLSEAALVSEAFALDFMIAWLRRCESGLSPTYDKIAEDCAFAPEPPFDRYAETFFYSTCEPACISNGTNVEEQYTTTASECKRDAIAHTVAQFEIFNCVPGYRRIYAMDSRGANRFDFNSAVCSRWRNCVADVVGSIRYLIRTADSIIELEHHASVMNALCAHFIRGADDTTHSIVLAPQLESTHIANRIIAYFRDLRVYESEIKPYATSPNDEPESDATSHISTIIEREYKIASIHNLARIILRDRFPDILIPSSSFGGGGPTSAAAAAGGGEGGGDITYKVSARIAHALKSCARIISSDADLAQPLEEILASIYIPEIPADITEVPTQSYIYAARAIEQIYAQKLHGENVSREDLCFELVSKMSQLCVSGDMHSYDEWQTQFFESCDRYTEHFKHYLTLFRDAQKKLYASFIVSDDRCTSTASAYSADAPVFSLEYMCNRLRQTNATSLQVFEGYLYGDNRIGTVYAASDPPTFRRMLADVVQVYTQRDSRGCDSRVIARARQIALSKEIDSSSSSSSSSASLPVPPPPSPPQEPERAEDDRNSLVSEMHPSWHM